MKSKIIYLYVKTHNKTGLKYLGKTSAPSPHEYTGSGKYWLNHLRKHGFDYSTEIIKECSSNEEVAYWGLYYSNLWDVVYAKSESGKKLWANERPESGNGGCNSEIAKKSLETRIKNGTYLNGIKKAASPESREKANQTKIRNGTQENSPEVIAKIKETKKRNGTDKNFKNLGNTPEAREKAKQTKIRNGTYGSTPEIVAKMRATKIKNGTLGKGSESSRLQHVRDKIGNSNAKNFELITPDGEIIIIRNLRKYCRDNNLKFDTIYKSRNGWKCSVINNTGLK